MIVGMFEHGLSANIPQWANKSTRNTARQKIYTNTFYRFEEGVFQSVHSLDNLQMAKFLLHKIAKKMCSNVGGFSLSFESRVHFTNFLWCKSFNLLDKTTVQPFSNANLHLNMQFSSLSIDESPVIMTCARE